MQALNSRVSLEFLSQVFTEEISKGVLNSPLQSLFSLPYLSKQTKQHLQLPQGACGHSALTEDVEWGSFRQTMDE